MDCRPSSMASTRSGASSVNWSTWDTKERSSLSAAASSNHCGELACFQHVFPPRRPNSAQWTMAGLERAQPAGTTTPIRTQLAFDKRELCRTFTVVVSREKLNIPITVEIEPEVLDAQQRVLDKRPPLPID